MSSGFVIYDIAPPRLPLLPPPQLLCFFSRSSPSTLRSETSRSSGNSSTSIAAVGVGVHVNIVAGTQAPNVLFTLEPGSSSVLL